MSGWDQKHDLDEGDDDDFHVIADLLIMLGVGIVLLVLDATGDVPLFALIVLSVVAIVLFIDAVRRFE